MKLFYPLIVALVAVLLLPTSALAYDVQLDLSSKSAGDTVEGYQEVADHLTISSTGSTVVVEEQNPVSAVFGAPNDYLSSWGNATKNGCLENPGSNPTMVSQMGYGKGFADSQKKHDYTFEFEEGWEVSEFSVRMLDFGDYNPNRKTNHEVVLTAYDSDNNDIGSDVLLFTTNNAVNPTSHWYAGDACTAEEGEPGNFVFDVTAPEGKTIAKLVLRVEEGMDPNIALSSLEYSFAPTDDDDDGVPNGEDLCERTASDIPQLLKDQGVNRWVWDGESWVTVAPKGKGKSNGPDFLPTMDYTYGCSCIQILDRIKDMFGDEMLGHYKFGCSKSVLEEWNAGKIYLETVEVPSDQTVGSAVSMIDEDVTYQLRAYGTYQYATWAGDPRADAKCSYRGSADPLGMSGMWVSGDNLPSPYTNYLETKVNGGVVDWGVPSGTCNESDNTYTMNMTGVDHLDFSIYDGGAIGDNSGNIMVDIFAFLW